MHDQVDVSPLKTPLWDMRIYVASCLKQFQKEGGKRVRPATLLDP